MEYMAKNDDTPASHDDGRKVEVKDTGGAAGVQEGKGIPRPLQIVGVVFPLVATLCAGVWTVVWTVTSQNADLQKALAKEQTNQKKEVSRQEEERTKQMQARLQEVTAKFGQEERSRIAEKDLQSLKTVEQQAKERISVQESKRQERDLEAKERENSAALQEKEDIAFAAAVAAVLAPANTPAAISTTSALATLQRYAAIDRHRQVLVAALLAKSDAIDTLEEAQLWTRLAEAISPMDFGLIADANRTARRHLAREVLGQFWYDFAVSSAPAFLVGNSDPGDVVRYFLEKEWPRNPEFVHNIIRRDIDDRIHVARSHAEFTKRLPLPKDTSADAARAPVSSFVMRQTGDLLVRYIESDVQKPHRLDISECYLPSAPLRNPASLELIGDDLFIDEPRHRH